MKDLSKIGQVENVKQMEYLNDIRKIGMGIIYGQVEAPHFIDTFEPYIDYMETPSDYLQALKVVSQSIHNHECSPDDLLLSMGRFTPHIQYEEEELSYDYDEYDNEDDDEDDVIGISIDIDDLSDEEIHQLLGRLLLD